jgi:ubiquinone/menaquinone biosynthesis C-methylase UbiE
MAAWWLYSQRPRQRVSSQEGLDDPEVVQAFNRMAAMPQMRLLRWFVARRALGLIQQGHVVDLGCGPGFLALELAQRAPNLNVTGIDLSDEMLSEATNNACRLGLDHRVAFKKGDAQHIPFPDGALDLVISTLSLHHWSHPTAVLDQIARVLQPGGAFLVFDLRRDMLAPAWLLLWSVTRLVVPPALRRVNEPLGSRDAAYTPVEAGQLARGSQLIGWRITEGPFWLTIEGRKISNSLGWKARL